MTSYSTQLAKWLRFRFSLRTLFMVVTLIAVSCVVTRVGLREYEKWNLLSKIRVEIRDGIEHARRSKNNPWKTAFDLGLLRENVQNCPDLSGDESSSICKEIDELLDSCRREFSEWDREMERARASEGIERRTDTDSSATIPEEQEP